MAKTNAERQAEYRAKAALRNNLEGEVRLNMYISSNADSALNELVIRCGMTKKELIEFLLTEELNRNKGKDKK